MILVFLILILILFIVGLIFSEISINICDLKLSNMDEKLNAKFLIKVRANLFGIIPLTILKFSEDSIKIFGIKILYEKIFDNPKLKKGMNRVKKNFKFSSLKILKPDLEKINLNLILGTESFLMTSLLIFLVSTLLSFGIQAMIKTFDDKKYRYKIKPDFSEENKIKLQLKGIFKIKTTNIIECVRLNNI